MSQAKITEPAVVTDDCSIERSTSVLRREPRSPIRLAGLEEADKREVELSTAAYDELEATQNDSRADDIGRALALGDRPIADSIPSSVTLEQLEELALQANPALRRRYDEYQAARARTNHLATLPDPKLGVVAFAQPIETAAGSQRANLSISQLIPSLKRLNAIQQQACFEAAALWQLYAVEQQAILFQLRSGWYQLYALERRVERVEAAQELAERLIELASVRLSSGIGQQSDVLNSTIAYTELERQRVSLEQRRTAVWADLNRLTNRGGPEHGTARFELGEELPDWEMDFLYGLVEANQPRIELARIRTSASRWGIEIARLKRVPDVNVTASWFAIDDNRPRPSFVDVGRDAWSVGASVNLPLNRRKYAAIEQESLWRHAASHDQVDEVRREFESLIVKAWSEAAAAYETASLYERTIVPQAQRMLEASEATYRTGDGDVDEVLENLRVVLTLESTYHDDLAALNVALARIRQATGVEWLALPQQSTAPVPKSDD